MTLTYGVKMKPPKQTPYNPGDIVEIEFPYLGNEGDKDRSVVIVSKTDFNNILPVIWCVKITTKPRGFSTEIKLVGQERQQCGLRDDSVINSAILFTVPKVKITGYYGALTRTKLNILLEAIKRIIA